MFPLDQLAIGQKAIIQSTEIDFLPLKLIEMGVLLSVITGLQHGLKSKHVSMSPVIDLLSVVDIDPFKLKIMHKMRTSDSAK